MKLIGVLCWYDERPSWLAGVVACLHNAGVTHLVAVDGAYSFYPGGQAHSNREQHDAIVEVCQALEMSYTIHAPRELFFGNEVEKRTLSLRLAETVAVPFDDWYFIVDADHFVTSAIGHLARLADTDCDVAEIRFREPYGAVPSAGCPLRCVFRAIPGLTYDGNHYTLRTPDGRDLQHEPVLDLSCVEIEHRTAERDGWRKDRQKAYAEQRDMRQVEAVA